MLVGGKPSVNLMLDQKKEVEPKTTSSPLSIFESTSTWIVLMISRSVAT